MHDSSHEQASRWRQAQGQEGPEGKEARSETRGKKLEEELMRDKGPVIQECDRDSVVQMIEESGENRKVMVGMLEESEDNRKMIESIFDGSDVEVELALQNYRTAGREVLGWDQGQADLMERGLRWAVEARRKERGEEQERIRGQEQGKKVRFGEGKPLEEAQTESKDETEITEGQEQQEEANQGRSSFGE